MNRILNIITCILMFCVSSCAQPTQTEQIDVTVKKVLTAINNKAYNELQNLVGNEMDSNLASVISKSVESKYFIDKYHQGNVEKLLITSNDSLDRLGRKKIKIELCKDFDSLTGLSDVSLLIYVGPPQIIPLTKISGLEIASNVNAQYRRWLIEKGTLYDFNPIYLEEYRKYRSGNVPD